MKFVPIPKALPPIPEVAIYDERPYYDAVAKLKATATSEQDFITRVMKAYENVRLPRMTPAQIAADPSASASHAAAVAHLTNLRDTFGRNGWDDKGSPLRIGVHGPAHWYGGPLDDFDAYAGQTLLGTDGERVMISVLNGERGAPGNRYTAAEAEGVLAHEINHMVWESEVGDSPHGDSNWRGGANEAWADALTFPFDDDWIEGENPAKGDPDGFRDVSKPTFKRVRDIPSARDFERGTANGTYHEAYTHAIADTLNQPMVAFANQFGRDAMGQVWYNALVHEMPQRVGPAVAARATVRAATKLYGAKSEQVAALRQAWHAIDVR